MTSFSSRWSVISSLVSRDWSSPHAGEGVAAPQLFTANLVDHAACPSHVAIRVSMAASLLVTTPAQEAIASAVFLDAADARIVSAATRSARFFSSDSSSDSQKFRTRR